MRIKTHIAKFAAFFFILMLMQKTGAGILFHNIFHVNENLEASEAFSGNQAISFACNCIDDFSSPLIDPVHNNLSEPLTQPVPVCFSYSQNIPEVFTFFQSLRAPPCTVA